MTTKALSTVALIGLSSLALAGTEKTAITPAPAPETCPWTLEAAALYLKADSEDSDGYEDQDFEFAYRLGVGYEFDCGWALRLRYFDFEGTDDGSSSEVGPEVQAFDLDAVHALSLGGFKGEYSLGVRYFSLEEPFKSGPDVDYDGWGPTVGIDLAYALGEAFSIYVTGRAAYVFGTDEENDTDIDTFLLEGGAGLQYTFPCCDCGSYVRLGVEGHQYYELAYDETDAALYGGALSFGFSF